MRFRPCIDLHNGVVKQIVGGTLRDDADDVATNFVAGQPSSYFAELYRRDGLTGGHVIMLGPGNEAAAESALAVYPGGLQIGGGITPRNAGLWIEKGADKVIATSYIFSDGQVDRGRLAQLVRAVGAERLVLDLSCRRRGDAYCVVADRWQTFTDVQLDRCGLDELAQHCAEFLIHAVDVEGRQQGMDRDVVEILSDWNGIPITYAGGVRSMDDVILIHALSGGRLDVTVGSALDIFGGSGIRYDELVEFDRSQR